MSGTMFPSNRFYLPIFCENKLPGSIRLTDTWANFLDSLPITIQSGWNDLAQEHIKEWNGTFINDIVVFNTEQDKMWFILRWS